MLAALLALAITAEAPPISPRHITLVGDAKIVFHPTEVLVPLTLSSSARDAATSRRATDEKVQKLFKALAAAGVDPHRIATTAQSTNPEYRGNEVVSSTSLWTGSITLTDMARVDEALTAAAKSGAQLSGTVQVKNTDHASYETQARIAAAADARKRAVGMVEALGAKVGLPASISDTTTALEVQYAGPFSVAPDGTVTTPYATMDLAVTSRVTVQFDITAP
jgi:uncharacterized protein YggE